jgi:hypothetical protein
LACNREFTSTFHGSESVVEAQKVPVEVVREPVGKTVLKNSGTNQNDSVLFQNF